MKSCIACGMPMEQADQFAMGDVEKDYCVFCARPDGTMQSLDEKKQSLAGFIIRTQGFDPVAAETTALAMMRKLPAWAKALDVK